MFSISVLEFCPLCIGILSPLPIPVSLNHFVLVDEVGFFPEQLFLFSCSFLGKRAVSFGKNIGFFVLVRQVGSELIYQVGKM